MAGLRYEHEYSRFDDHLDKSVFCRRENYFFPSLSYHVKIKNAQLGLSYAIKTRRPEFTETNDAIVYLNRYSLSQGNSRLETEVKHELSLQLRYRQLTCGLNYEHRRRAIITNLKDNALTLRLEAKDVLGMTQEDVTIDYGYSVLQQQKRHDNRRICLSLRYSL